MRSLPLPDRRRMAGDDLHDAAIYRICGMEKRDASCAPLSIETFPGISPTSPGHLPDVIGFRNVFYFNLAAHFRKYANHSSAFVATGFSSFVAPTQVK